jgi:hypothetical protein
MNDKGTEKHKINQTRETMYYLRLLFFKLNLRIKFVL